MSRIVMACLAMLVLASMLTMRARAQQPVPTPVPDAQAVLNRANEVAELARVTAEQNVSTIDLVRNLAWFFGVILAVVAFGLGMFGFNTQRGFQDMMKDHAAELRAMQAGHDDGMREYRTELSNMQASYRGITERYQQEQGKVQTLTERMADKVKEIEAIREELSAIKQSVTEEFTAAKQSLVLLSIGNQHFAAGRHARAIEFYEEAWRLQPEDAQINFRLGRAYSNVSRLQEAIESLEKAVYSRPDLVEAHMELGLAYRRIAETASSAEDRGWRYRLAERFLLRALDLRPDYADALGTLGGLYRREMRYRESLEQYRRASRVDPHSSYAWANVASLSWYLGDDTYAREAFQNVETIASERIKAGRTDVFWDYYDRALARLVLNECGGAVSDHEFAIQHTPNQQNLESVLDNLRFLRRAPQPIEGLDRFIAMVEERLVPAL